MFAVPSFFGYNTTFVSTPVATAATGIGQTSFTANWNAFVGASYYLLDVSTSSSFSSFVGSYQNFVVLSTSQLVSGLTASTTYYYRLRAATGVDADAAAFFGRVYTAGGALSYTEVSATETLVADLKANSLWTPMKAVYPMIGASAAACAQNLKSSSFTGTFTSGWTFASTGATPNGTSAYMDTGLKPSNLGQDSTHLGIYSRTDVVSAAQIDIGMYTAANSSYLAVKYSGLIYPTIQTLESSGGTSPYTTTLGLIVGNRNNSTQTKFYKNASLLNTFARNSTTPNTTRNIYLACYNADGVASLFSTKQFALATLGDGLTDANVSSLYTAVQAFQTTLGRQIAP
jgi:hypothetical protein